jgi:hypothetical protein
MWMIGTQQWPNTKETQHAAQGHGTQKRVKWDQMQFFDKKETKI